MNSEKRRVLLLGVLVLIALGIFAAQFFHGPEYPRNENRLALGKSAKVDREPIAFNQSMDLGGLSLSQIKDARTQAVQQHPELLKSDYQPYGPIFDQIGSGKPWFGTVGFYFLGPAPESIEGPSAESRILLNPFLLLAPEFYGLSIWSEGGLVWNHSSVPDSTLHDKNFPLFPKPQGLYWEPRSRRGGVSYDVTDFLSAVHPYTAHDLGIKDVNFAVSAYNARDLGLFYLYLDLQSSRNITNLKQPKTPRLITDRLQDIGNHCGANNACNHRGIFMPNFDNLRVTQLPATAVFKLWGYKPSGMDAKNAFEFRIELE